MSQLIRLIEQKDFLLQTVGSECLDLCALSGRNAQRAHSTHTRTQSMFPMEITHVFFKHLSLWSLDLVWETTNRVSKRHTI